MPLKTRRKRCHKLDRLLSTLSIEDQAEFRDLCQFNPSYSTIRDWFRERDCEISINGIFCWWRSNFPDSGESKILKGIAISLGQDFDKPPYNSVLRLAVTAAQVLSDYSTGKLSKDPHSLMEIQLELFSGLRSLSSCPVYPSFEMHERKRT